MQLFLSILYWLILVLAVIVFVAPAEIWPSARVLTVLFIVLFIILGLRSLKLGS